MNGLVVPDLSIAPITPVSKSDSSPRDQEVQFQERFLSGYTGHAVSKAHHAITTPQATRSPATRNTVSNPVVLTTASPAIGATNAPASPALVCTATAVAATRESTTSYAYMNAVRA